jgi:hypothetical protein
MTVRIYTHKKLLQNKKGGVANKRINKKNMKTKKSLFIAMVSFLI